MTPRKKQASASIPAITPIPAETIRVGIDWADGEHEYVMMDPQGAVHRGSFEQSPKAIATLLNTWQRDFPNVIVEVCLETSRGPLIHGLLEYSHVRIYPVNPNALANYRKAFAHGGGKTDPVDANLILQFLLHYREQLRELKQNSPLTRELSLLCEDRRQLVEQRVVLAQQLKTLVKGYFPAILTLQPAKVYADFILRLLQKYPTLKEVQAAGRNKLRKLFFGCGTKNKIEERLDVLLNAQPLTRDEVLLRTSTRRVQAIGDQLLSLNQAIRGYDREIKRLLLQHPDYRTIQGLPCGVISQARLIAALGDDRARYGSAEELASAAGIAPLTTHSGKMRLVSSRWACSKFLRQTFHEFAGIAIKRSGWSKAYYGQQVSRGKPPQMAKRALAFKWIRIIYRCWQSREAYDESRYVARLHATQSPLSTLLAG